MLHRPGRQSRVGHPPALAGLESRLQPANKLFPKPCRTSRRACPGGINPPARQVLETDSKAGTPTRPAPIGQVLAPRRAAAAVELAILLPLLVFLFVVAVDFSRIFYFALTVTNCARNGALYASDPVAAAESPYRSSLEAALADANGLNPRPTVSAPSYGTNADGSRYVEVTVMYPFQTITRYPGVPSRVDLARTVRMRVARPLPNLP